MASHGKIVGTVVVGPEHSDYYGKLIVNDIKYEDNTQVTVEKFLRITLKSPKLSTGIAVDPQFAPWDNLYPVISKVANEDGTVSVTTTISFSKAHLIKPTDSLTWEINGNLNSPPGLEAYRKSFEFFADELPSGIVDIKCAAVQHQELAKYVQTIHFQHDNQLTSFSVLPGEGRIAPLFSGKYTVTANVLTNAAKTITVTPKVTPNQITIETGTVTIVDVTY